MPKTPKGANITIEDAIAEIKKLKAMQPDKQRFSLINEDPNEYLEIDPQGGPKGEIQVSFAVLNSQNGKYSKYQFFIDGDQIKSRKTSAISAADLNQIKDVIEQVYKGLEKEMLSALQGNEDDHGDSVKEEGVPDFGNKSKARVAKEMAEAMLPDTEVRSTQGDALASRSQTQSPTLP